MTTKTKKQGSHILPFGLGIASSAMSYVVVTQLTYCLVDSYGMTAALVGTIFLLSRVFDGITDIIAGFIVDKTHTKLGKARPYDLVAIPLWIILILCFNIPDFSLVGKVIWIALTYNLCQSVCYTFVTVAQTVRVKRSFPEDIRSKALAIGGLISAIFSTIVSIAAPILISIFEKQPGGWTIIISCFAVPGIIMSLIQFFMVPENVVDEEEVVAQKNSKISDSVKALFSNKYIFVVAVCIIMISMVNTVLGTAGNFYFKYVVGDIRTLSLVSMVSLAGYVLIVIMPVLTRRFGNRVTMIIAFSLMLLGNILKYVFKVNVPGLALCAALSAVGVTLAQCMRDLLVIDCMKYGQWKSKNNFEGIYSSVKGFSDKIALGLGSLLSGLILDVSGFDSALEAQTEGALHAVQFLYSGLPAILAGIGVIAMVCYGLDQKLKQIEAEKTAEA